jgi:hypothetical protein
MRLRGFFVGEGALSLSDSASTHEEEKITDNAFTSLYLSSHHHVLLIILSFLTPRAIYNELRGAFIRLFVFVRFSFFLSFFTMFCFCGTFGLSSYRHLLFGQLLY